MVVLFLVTGEDKLPRVPPAGGTRYSDVTSEKFVSLLPSPAQPDSASQNEKTVKRAKRISFGLVPIFIYPHFCLVPPFRKRQKRGGGETLRRQGKISKTFFTFGHGRFGGFGNFTGADYRKFSFRPFFRSGSGSFGSSFFSD